MKQSERRHLRENEIAAAVRWTTARLAAHGRALGWTLAVAALVVAGVGGYLAWRWHVEDRASRMLADAMMVATAPVVTPAEMLTNPPAPGQQTFSSTEERAKAAVPALLEAADAYPSTSNGIAARYYAAAALLESGQLDEARQQYRQVIERGGNGLWARMARLGLASVDLHAKRYDAAIARLRDLADESDGELPTDGLLMQLAQAYQQAGKHDEAVETYNRLVNDFPESLYVSDAKSRVEALKAPASAAL